MRGEHTREVAGVWLWCAHPLRADPVRSGDAQHLNGQGHAANRLESSLRASLKPEDARSREPVARITAQITSSGNASSAARLQFGSVVAILTSVIPAIVSQAGDGIKRKSEIRLTFLRVRVLTSAASGPITRLLSPSTVWGVPCARPTLTSSAGGA